MESIGKQVKEIWRKYKYVILIIVIGILFILLPIEKKETSSMQASMKEEEVSEESDLETRLREILFQIEGVGKVEVMLTIVCGEEVIYQTDGGGYTGQIQKESTIILNRADRSQYGLVRQKRAPQYLGAIVVCQGGGKPQVKMSVTEAVAKATGLASNQITVLKMK